METLKRFQLLDAKKVQGDIIRKKLQQYILGGYGGYGIGLTCKTTWKDGHSEEGSCAFSTEDACCEKVKTKYPEECFGEVTSCSCE